MTEASLEVTSQEYDIIRQYLSRLDLTSDQVELYLYLHILGPSTVVGLSKAMGTGRTRLYPVLESLQNLQLVVIHERHYGTKYEALSPQSLEFLVHERETKALGLRRELADVQRAILELSQAVTHGSKVIEYKGVEGLKQINFNLTKAKDAFYVFEAAHLDDHPGMPQSFVERLRRTWWEKKILSHDITNNKDWDFIPVPGTNGQHYQRACYVPAEVFEIQIETYIYNDCIAYLQYDRDKVFGVEIYNSLLSRQQKQLYDMVWNMGTEIK